MSLVRVATERTRADTVACVERLQGSAGFRRNSDPLGFPLTFAIAKSWLGPKSGEVRHDTSRRENAANKRKVPWNCERKVSEQIPSRLVKVCASEVRSTALFLCPFLAHGLWRGPPFLWPHFFPRPTSIWSPLNDPSLKQCVVRTYKVMES